MISMPAYATLEVCKFKRKIFFLNFIILERIYYKKVKNRDKTYIYIFLKRFIEKIAVVIDIGTIEWKQQWKQYYIIFQLSKKKFLISLKMFFNGCSTLNTLNTFYILKLNILPKIIETYLEIHYKLMNFLLHVKYNFRCISGPLYGVCEESSYGRMVLLQWWDYEQTEATRRGF